ncbi:MULTISPECIES: hypothetical protein [unclassified Nocardioides]|uniref:hypothetical protein n=1 Tax=unclassified Nocardioides TaxID=2615069 RepID=UPI0012E3ADD2|nr:MULTISPECIES: hypothetical protein [unclassified Nocardioides]
MHAPVDTCALLSADDQFEVIGAEKVTGVGAEMDPGDARLARCVVAGNDGVALIYYGFSQVPGRKFAADLRRSADFRGTLTPLAGVGDEALYVRDSKYGFDAWARKGDYAVFVGSGWFQGSQATVQQLLTTLLDQATPGMHEHPIQVPRACPSPRSKMVTAAVGEVKYATGHDTDEAGLLCTYAGKRVRVSLAAGRSTRKEVADGYARLKAGPKFGDDESVEFKIVPGALTVLEPSVYGPWASTFAFKPPALIRASMNESIDSTDGRDIRFSQAAFRRVNEAWVRNRIAALS